MECKPLAVVVLALLVSGCPPKRVAVDQRATSPSQIEFGPLTLEVSFNRSASLFHAVDQMADWYPAHHPVFDGLKDSPPLSSAQSRALDEQRALRVLHPWGSGLEQAYYLGHADAVDPPSRQKEDRVLSYFDHRLDDYLYNAQEHVEHFAGTLQRLLPRYAPIFTAVGTLAGTPKRLLPLVLVARPGAGVGGGGANGGVLVVEVTLDEASITPVVHEATHALLESRRDAIRAAVRRCGAGLDPTTLEEGIATAVAPGLIHDGDPSDDPLSHVVANDNHTRFEGNVPYRALGLAMRPALSHALDGGDFEGLLNDGCEAWKRIRR